MDNEIKSIVFLVIRSNVKGGVFSNSPVRMWASVLSGQWFCLHPCFNAKAMHRKWRGWLDQSQNVERGMRVTFQSETYNQKGALKDFSVSWSSWSLFQLHRAGDVWRPSRNMHSYNITSEKQKLAQSYQERCATMLRPKAPFCAVNLPLSIPLQTKGPMHQPIPSLRWRPQAQTNSQG